MGQRIGGKSQAGSAASAAQPRPDAVTMAMVGRLAGVSQVTVSRALNDPGKVSRPTRDRIEAAIRATGYVPNLTAAALASRRTRLVAAVVPSITNIVYAALIGRFTAAIREAGYQVLLGESGYSEDEETDLVENLLSRRPDAVLLTGVRHAAACRRMLLAAAIPAVEVWDLTDTPIDICVGFDHADAGRAVARFVAGRGHARAAVVTAGDSRAGRRAAAFSETFMSLAGEAPVPVAVAGPASLAAGRRAAADLLDRGFVRGAVFCSSDLLAHGVLIEAAARGIGVPDELAVIGFGDQDFAAHVVPALTSVHVDRDRLGALAADAMLRRLAGEPLETPSIDIGFSIVVRQSA